MTPQRNRPSTASGGPGRRPRRPGPWALDIERRGRSATTSAQRDEIRAWFAGNLTDGWFTGEPEITVDDYEILVVGALEDVQLADADDAARRVAESARIGRYREDTRERRITIASAAEERFGRHVAWGARVGSTTELFTTAAVPVMTRLRMRQRQTLDTLVEAGVARSRSEALAWCVELVARNEGEWISRLREALDTVERARAEGPGSAEEETS